MTDTELWDRVEREITPPMPDFLDPVSPLQQRRRRGFPTALDDGREAVELVRDDGVLRWVYRPPAGRASAGRRGWRSAGVDPRDLVRRFEYPPLGHNRITQALVALDEKLNPTRGLRRWRNQRWECVQPGELEMLAGRVLLLVHGTFSRSEMFDSELLATPEGAELFHRCAREGSYASDTRKAPYEAVLAFDHATLSVAPWLNALALKEMLVSLPAQLDIVCHSRGGLVVGWALKLGLPRIDQVIFVGAPLMGTSLAAPDRLREALDLLANIADAVAVLSKGAALAFPPALPLAMGAAGLAQVLGRTLNLGSHLLVPDAIVGLVPGLMSQSRVQNNLELNQLFPLPSTTRVSGVGVTFKPNEVAEPVWKFWSRFSNLADQAKYYGAELIFRQGNDLVVDTTSMYRLGNDAQIADWTWLGESPITHHCSYFRSADVVDFLEKRLQ